MKIYLIIFVLLGRYGLASSYDKYPRTIELQNSLKTQLTQDTLRRVATNDSIVSLAKQNAHHDYTTSSAVTLLTAFIFLIAPFLLVAFVIAYFRMPKLPTTTPAALAQNPVYVETYKRETRRLKRKHLLIGLALAFGAALTFALTMTMLLIRR